MIDIDIMCEAFTVLKEYIPAKDRQPAAEHLFNALIDLDIAEKDLKVFCQSDTFLSRVFDEYFQDDLDADERDFDYNDQDD
jgi:hypothetical protein